MNLGISLTRVRARAFQQRCRFFAVTSVTRAMKIEQVLSKISAKISDKNRVEELCFVPIFQSLHLEMLKIFFEISCNGLEVSDLRIDCDTCDSKKAKTPVMYARVRVREKVSF